MITLDDVSNTVAQAMVVKNTGSTSKFESKVRELVEQLESPEF